MRSDQGGRAQSIITPPPATITPGLLTTGDFFLNNHIWSEESYFSGLKTWSCDAICFWRSTEGKTRRDLLAIMDYSKAQMVSVDEWLVTLPLVFVTVTKPVKALAT